MLRRMEMPGRVPILRIVAAADMAAGSAEPQMHPSIAELEALLATATTWTVGPHNLYMPTLCRHGISSEPATKLHPNAESSMD
jgi:hypothetical protein